MSFIELTLCPQHTNSVDAIFRILGADPQRLLTTIEFPLNSLVFSSQVQRRWWVRNGTVMLDQSMNYAELHVCRALRDHDLMLLQIYGAVRNDIDSFLTALLYRFGVLNIFSDSAQNLNLRSSLLASDPDPEMIEEVLILFTQILTELPIDVSLLDTEYKGQSRVTIRRELVHNLALGPIVFSELHDTIYRASEISKLVEEVISDVSESRDMASAGVATSTPKRILKPEIWQEYDPCYYHYLQVSHQKAQDSRPSITSPQPMVAAPSLAHTSFQRLRNNILTSKAVFLPLLKKLTLAAAKVRVGSSDYKYVNAGARGEIGKMNIFTRVLQLLTLTIHILDSLSDSDNSYTDVSQSGQQVSDSKQGGGSSAITMSVVDNEGENDNMATIGSSSSDLSMKEKAKRDLSEFFLSQESTSTNKMMGDDDYHSELQPHVLGALVDLQLALANDASESNICNWLKW